MSALRDSVPYIIQKQEEDIFCTTIFFQERKIPVNNLQSFIVDYPEPWCVIYEVFLILWHIIIVLSISLKLSHFLLVLCIAFQRLNNIFSLILCKAPPPPPLPTLENKQLCEDCFALGQSAVCIRCKQGGTFLM